MNELNDDKFSPLHLAIFNGNIKLALSLASSGENVNLQDLTGSTALHLYLIKDCIDSQSVKYLLSLGAMVNIKDNSGNTLLHVMNSQCVYESEESQSKLLEVAELLVNQGINEYIA